jgi:hypothetical protein
LPTYHQQAQSGNCGGSPCTTTFSSALVNPSLVAVFTYHGSVPSGVTVDGQSATLAFSASDNALPDIWIVANTHTTASAVVSTGSSGVYGTLAAIEWTHMAGASADSGTVYYLGSGASNSMPNSGSLSTTAVNDLLILEASNGQSPNTTCSLPTGSVWELAWNGGADILWAVGPTATGYYASCSVPSGGSTWHFYMASVLQ